jgi:hypothetical protein
MAALDVPSDLGESFALPIGHCRRVPGERAVERNVAPPDRPGKVGAGLEDPTGRFLLEVPNAGATVRIAEVHPIEELARARLGERLVDTVVGPGVVPGTGPGHLEAWILALGGDR